MLNNAILVISASLIISSCSGNSGTNSENRLEDTFAAIQKQTIDRTCSIGGCHSGAMPKALLDLSTLKAYSSLMNNPIQNDAGKTRYRALIVPGKPDSSFLYIKITAPKSDEGVLMPERLGKIPDNEIDAIRRWIEKGAPND